jgi:hypothetical protein
MLILDRTKKKKKNYPKQNYAQTESAVPLSWRSLKVRVPHQQTADRFLPLSHALPPNNSLSQHCPHLMSHTEDPKMVLQYMLIEHKAYKYRSEKLVVRYHVKFGIIT